MPSPASNQDTNQDTNNFFFMETKSFFSEHTMMAHPRAVKIGEFKHCEADSKYDILDMDQLTSDYENASEIDMSKPDIKEVIDDLAEKEVLHREHKELQQYRIVGEKVKEIYGTETWNRLGNMKIPEMDTEIQASPSDQKMKS